MVNRQPPSAHVAPVFAPASTSVVDRIFAILECCAASRRTVSLAEIGRLTGLPKATLHRLCWKLASLGALEHRADGFRIGPKLFALGAINPLVQRLRTQSMPFLHSLSSETGLGASLAVMRDERALLLDEVFAEEKPLPRMNGSLLPLHATALGKILLAAEPPARRRAIVGAEALPRLTRYTIVRPDLLLEQLATVEQTGIAFSLEESRLGFAAVAAPIQTAGTTVGALAVVGIPHVGWVDRYVNAVRRAATGVGSALQHPVMRQRPAPNEPHTEP
jgi:DNA-binding IclR family transcriptional regulator